MSEAITPAISDPAPKSEAALLEDIGLSKEQIAQLGEFIREFRVAHSYGWEEAIMEDSSPVIENDGDLLLEVSPSSRAYDCWTGSATLFNYLSQQINDPRFSIGILKFEGDPELEPMRQHFRAFILNQETKQAISLDLVPLYSLIAEVPEAETLEKSIELVAPIDLAHFRFKSLYTGLILKAELGENGRARFIQVSWDEDWDDDGPVFRFIANSVGTGTKGFTQGKYVARRGTKKYHPIKLTHAAAYRNWTSIDYGHFPVFGLANFYKGITPLVERLAEKMIEARARSQSQG